MIKSTGKVLLGGLYMTIGLLCMLILGIIGYGALLFLLFSPGYIMESGDYRAFIPWFFILFCVGTYIYIDCTKEVNKDETQK